MSINKSIKKIFSAILSGCMAATFFPACIPSVSAQTDLLGDVNFDTVCNAVDAALILEDAAEFGCTGTHFLTDYQLTLCDLDRSGTVDAMDAAYLLDYASLTGTMEGELSLSEYMDIMLNQETAAFQSMSFPVCNRQCAEAETTSYDYMLSEHDIELLQSFADSQFKASDTLEDKLYTTMMWIHNNVGYANTSAEWGEISGCSYTEAIFEHKLGQCVQYNGAMASMMVYLGCENVSLVKGYRGYYPGNIWQHFWVEVEKDGCLYVMETGNQETDGSWWYFMTPYKNTRKYVRNLVNM